MLRPAEVVTIALLAATATAAPPRDETDSLRPGEAGIVSVLHQLRQTNPKDTDYAGLVVRLDRLSRPQDVPVLLRELPKGPTEPLIDIIAGQWKGDRIAQAAWAVSPSPAVRRAALRAAAYSGLPTAADFRLFIDRFINDHDDAVRREAAAAVHDYGGVAFAKLLVDGLDKTPPARLADVVRLMGEQGDPARNGRLSAPSTPADALAVTKKLEQLMTHADAAVRAAAVSHPPPSQTFWPTPAAARLADDPDARVRLSLARTLRPQLAGGTPTAIHLLDDADPLVRGEAVDAVMFAPIMQSTLRPENIVAKLAERANDTDPFVRGRLKILPHFWTTPAVVAPFGRALAGDRGPRLAALEAMAFGAPAALGPVIEKLLDDLDPITRARAFAAAGNLPLNGPRLLRIADAALNDKDPSVRGAASQAMAQVSRADMRVVMPATPDAEPGYARRTADLKIPPEAAAAKPRAFALVNAYTDRLDADAVLDLLGGDPAGVDAGVALLRDLADRPWGSLQPIIARAATRGGRAASMVGIILRESTRAATARRDARPDEANPLTRAIRTAAGGAGRDAALARLALHETPATEAAAAGLLLKDPVAAVRAVSVLAVQVGRADGVVPPGVLAALDDADPAVAGMAAAGLSAALANARRDAPLPEPPQPAAGRLDAADATVRAAAIAESSAAAAGVPLFVEQWVRLMADPDPAVRSAVAAALRQAYADRSPPGRG